MAVKPTLRIAVWAGALPILVALAALQRADPLAEPFKGVTTDGTIVPGLFTIRSTGVTTTPVREAAQAFLGTLTPEQRAATSYPLDDPEWRKWNNVHRYARQGVSFKEMTDAQRETAFGLLKAGLSAKGLEKSRNIMRLNETLAELTKRFEEYGEGLYHITVMGEPSDAEPWGWQLDGHHLVINYFILRDQVVMTPTFMGSEPIHAESGKYAGTTVLQEEQNKGLALVQALTPGQRKQAIIQPEKTANNAQAQAFRDNLVLGYAGISARELTTPQRKLLLDTIAEYVGNMSPGHAKVRMEEVERHLDATYFAWVGGTTDEAVFYYRIHSPVILVEFDHQTPVALPGPRVPGRRHIHSVVRTPNGNDYGKDLLRQHYEAHRNDPAHGHQ
ncbi:MAG TPA: DUF3500 domain-containing protein [Vicinamibacterales bacterium]|nr:DUF3500 domain-containing protein [Vicinamibacterales bacterium]